MLFVRSLAAMALFALPVFAGGKQEVPVKALASLAERTHSLCQADDIEYLSIVRAFSKPI